MPTVYACWQRRLRRQTVNGDRKPLTGVEVRLGSAQERETSLAMRLGDATRRRARHAWRQAVGYPAFSPVESTLAWLDRHCGSSGVSPCVGASSCPGLTGAVLPTAVQFAQHDLSQRLADW